MSDLFRSVQVGCSRFSRCCHLLVDLSSISRWKLGQAINAVTGTRRLSAMLPIKESELCGCRQAHRSAVAQRFVSFSAHSQAMQQHGQLSGGRDHRSLLPIFPAALGQLQTPAPQIAVRSKRSQNVVRTLHQQRS